MITSSNDYKISGRVHTLSHDGVYFSEDAPELRIGNPLSGVLTAFVIACGLEFLIFWKIGISFGIFFGIVCFFALIVIGYTANIKGNEIRRYNESINRKGGYYAGLLFGEIAINHMKRKYSDFNPNLTPEEETKDEELLWTCSKCNWKSEGLYCDRCGLPKGDSEKMRHLLARPSVQRY